MEFREDVRPSPIEGTWYNANWVRLASEIDAYLQSAKISPDEYEGKLVGLVAPHAGHRFSGRTAAYAYRLAQNYPRKLAVIFSPFHHYTTAELITTAHRAYETPLGEVAVDTAALSTLDEKLKASGLRLVQVAEDDEHAIEIQLPFLQYIWKFSFKLIPLMVRSYNPSVLKQLATALYETIKERDFLLIASTDLSHFYPLDYAETLDAEMLKHIKDIDPEGVLKAEAEGSGSACGAGGVAAMLWTAKMAGANKAYILNYSTSADTTQDRASVVGYGAAAIFS